VVRLGIKPKPKASIFRTKLVMGASRPALGLGGDLQAGRTDLNFCLHHCYL
jgi:hypothetical protein